MVPVTVPSAVCYQIGLCLGLGIWFLLLCRDGIRWTVLYWANPPSFIGPAEHFGSLLALQEMKRNLPRVSPWEIIFGLAHGLFASLVAGLLFGGFLAIQVFLALSYQVK